MNSKIEQMISEIEEYIESCKPRMFSGSTIVVDKETMEELLTELRLKTPEEIKRYQKIISQKEAILADANAKAQQMLLHAEEMQAAQVSEHEIMQHMPRQMRLSALPNNRHRKYTTTQYGMPMKSG